MIRRFDVTPPGYTGAEPAILCGLAERLPRASTQIRALTFTRKAVYVELQHPRWTADRHTTEAAMLKAVGEGVVANVRGCAVKRAEGLVLWAAACSTAACGLVAWLQLDALAPASILAGAGCYLLGRAHEARRG